MWTQTLLVALTIGVAVVVAGLAIRSRALFHIRVTPNGVRLRGQVPGHTPNDVTDFITSLDLPRGATIRALPEGRRFRLEFSRAVPKDEHQRLRNYFLSAAPLA